MTDLGQIKSCPQCGAALSETTLGGLCPACAAGAVLALASGSLPGAPLPESPTESTGARPTDFGEFELIEEIARGGMGVVYKARQKRLNRLVALKMILAGRFAGEEQVKRFRAEAEAAASLRHPNIVAIHDVGEVAGQHYFCMDLIEGPNLNGLVRDRPLSHLKAALLVQEVAQAVQYAHEHGVVHRDLKPSNIIIDLEGRPHVTDFGLAKRLGEDSDLTQSGQMLGSPNFAAPEQAAGRTHEVGSRSDVYSLGAILYYLLVGRPPFLAESIEQTLSMVAGNDPVPLRKLDPGVPRDLETICLKCLEKEPARRYASAGLLADELGRSVRGEPIQARPIGAPEKLLRWTRRNRTVAVLAVFAATVLLLGAGGVFWQWRRAERSAQDEHRQRTRAEDTVIELQWQRAEDLLSHGESSKGLVLLAGMLRQSPTNRAVAERILNALTQRRFPLPVTPLLRHQGAVVDAAFNADGTRVATASADGTASVWDAETGQRVAGPITHGAAVTAIRFSPDGTRIMTASKDRSVRFWKCDTGLQDGPSLQHSNSVVALELSPDGEFALTTTRMRNVSLWRLTTGTLAFPSISHTSQVRAARFSPDGTRFLTASLNDGLVRVFDVATGRELHSKDFDGWITSARFSPDGQRIAVANYHQWGAVWNPGGTEELVTVRHRSVVNDAMFSPDGELFATISRDRRALVWDSRTGDLVFALPAHLTWVEEMAFRPDGLALITREESDRVVVWDLLTSGAASEPVRYYSPLNLVRLAPDGKTLLLGAIDGTAQIWNIAPAGVAPLSLPHGRPASAVAFSPDGGRVITGTTEGRAVVWDSVSGTAGPVFQHREVINEVTFSPDGSNVLTASSDNTARVWNLATGKSVAARHRQRILHAEFSPDGRSFLTASFYGTAGTWSTETGELLGKAMYAGGRVWHAEFSPDGRWVATAAEDTVRQSEHQARVWDARTCEPVTPPLRHGEGVFRVSFDPSGRFLATASRDGTAALWNVDSGTRLLEVKHDGPVAFVDFSPDGAHILTASLDNTARIWDARTGQPMGERMRHGHELRFAAWSPDGRRVATACEDGSARVWDAATGKPVTEFLWHLGSVAAVHFSPDGGRLACAARPTRLWNLPSVSNKAPDWLPALAEAVAGSAGVSPASETTTDPQNAGAPRADLTQPRFSGQQDLFALREQLTARSDPEPLIPWAKAFFGHGVLPALGSKPPGDPPVTVAGPNSVTAAAWAAMGELHANPSNSTAWSQLYQHARRQEDQLNPHRKAQAEYFSRKTVTLGATNLAFWLERIRWLNQSNRHKLLPEAAVGAARYFPNEPQFQLVK